MTISKRRSSQFSSLPSLFKTMRRTIARSNFLWKKPAISESWSQVQYKAACHLAAPSTLIWWNKIILRPSETAQSNSRYPTHKKKINLSTIQDRRLIKQVPRTRTFRYSRPQTAVAPRKTNSSHWTFWAARQANKATFLQIEKPALSMTKLSLSARKKVPEPWQRAKSQVIRSCSLRWSRATRSREGFTDPLFKCN